MICSLNVNIFVFGYEYEDEIYGEFMPALLFKIGGYPLRKKKKAAKLAVNQDQNVVQFKQFLPHKKNKVTIYPKNLNQEDYLLKLQDQSKDIVFAIGPAGTGKTMIACQQAVKMFQEGEVDKVVVTRPAVSVDEQHGFLPGDLNEKMAPWTRPIFDVFEEYFYAKEIQGFIAEGVLEISPLAYMRGRTFKNSIIIADEMQNATPSQMKMLLTRLGTGSTMIVTGDLQQADRPDKNGLLEFLNLYNNFESQKRIDVCRFTSDDIERHEAVKEVLAIYGELNIT
jgi:phosphate starvation-inducible protein PhoH and related proteins